MARSKLVICGPPGTQEIILEPRGVLLGRGSGCDVTLDHYNISRVHARFSQDPFGHWIVEDMDSRNGVLISGQRVHKQVLQYGQVVTIHPFELTVVSETEQKDNMRHPAKNTFPMVDHGAEERISLFRGDATVMFSPTMVRYLNELSGQLLQLNSPANLYLEATRCLSGMLVAQVAVVRLPSATEPLPESPEVLALHCQSHENRSETLKNPYVHFSKRVLDAARRTDSPIMAGSVHAPGENLRLTIVDAHQPHQVFSAPVNKLDDYIDFLYIDIQESQCPDHMFDFVEAAARQINFSQKSLFLAEMKKQEQALREANAKLKQKDRIKDEYVARVTHDMKGHLAAIQNCLYAVVETSDGCITDRPADFLQRALNRTKELTAFIRNLLRLTQMRLSGQFEVEPFCLSRVLQNAITAVEDKASGKSIRLNANIRSNMDQIIGNAFSVTEMITNLLFNAIKYTPEGQAVRLEARDTGEQIRIDVIDTGIGIPAEEHEAIFDEFYRASNATKSRQEGSGLGLSIVKQIAESHGGSITVDSKVGEGSTFTVLLPKDSPSQSKEGMKPVL